MSAGQGHSRKGPVSTKEGLWEQAHLLNLAHDAIIVRDLAGCIRFWNEGATRLYGWSAAETQGQSITEFIYPEMALFQRAASELAEKGLWFGEVQQPTRDGQTRVVASRWTLLSDPGGQPHAVLSIDTDITEKKQLEAQCLRTQRLEGIGTLASGIAHDLNNILAPMLMSCAMLREGTQVPEELRMLDTIEGSAQRAADLVKQLLTFSRGMEGHRVALQPRHLIRELVQMVQATFPKNISLRTQIDSNLWPLQGDATQIHQVLLNLCLNARDAMPSGGALTLNAENVRLDEHYAAMTPEAKVGPHVLLQVADSGHGIPPELVDRIFEPFFTTKGPGKGTGLGLSTVLGIVRGHGGFVSVQSAVGKGTTFKVFLPATPDAPVEPPTRPARSLKGNGELILVVDDEAPLLEVTRRTLSSNGYRVLTAHDGTEGLTQFLEHRNAVQVVLTDILMPFLDGVAMIRAVKKVEPHSRIIASSGLAFGQTHADRMAELGHLGVTRFLAKPYTAEELLTLLAETLRPSAAETA